jgi:hypothetical protein
MEPAWDRVQWQALVLVLLVLHVLLLNCWSNYILRVLDNDLPVPEII